MDIKERMANVGMTQVDMILELQKRGYAVQPPMMSSILRGVYTYPKAKQILAVCEEILKERENEWADGTFYLAFREKTKEEKLVAALNATSNSITDVQVALAEVYEMVLGGK